MIYKNNSIKAVIFDMDGTLIDTDDALVPMFKQLFKTGGIEVSKEEILKYTGMEFESWVKKLLPEPNKKALREIKEKWGEIYPEGFFKYMKTIKGAEEMLGLFKENYKLVLLTNTPKEMALDMLEKFELKKYFDLILGRREDFEKAKPHPEALFVALEKLGIEKDQVVFIGDTKYDKKAGKRAGIRTLILREDIQNLKEVKKFI